MQEGVAVGLPKIANAWESNRSHDYHAGQLWV